MSRYRKVDTRTWGDAKFRRLSHDAQRVWLYLLTGPETTSLPGVIVAGPAALAEGCDLSPKAFGEAFGEALREGMLKACLESRLVWLQNATKYNRPESPNVVKSWRDAWDNVPECSLKGEIFKHLKAFTEGLGEAFGKAFREGCAKPLPNQDQEQEQEIREERELDSESLFGSTQVRKTSVESVWSHWLSLWRTNRGSGTPPKLSKDRRRLLVARLDDGQTVEQLCAAADGLWSSAWHRENNQINFELCYRKAGQVEKYEAMAAPPLAPVPPSRPIGPTLREATEEAYKDPDPSLCPIDPVKLAKWKLENPEKAAACKDRTDAIHAS